jgi:hypothetical protein
MNVKGGIFGLVSLLLPLSMAWSDWTPWQIIRGDATQGLDISTNTGSFNYDNELARVVSLLKQEKLIRQTTHAR